MIVCLRIHRARDHPSVGFPTTPIIRLFDGLLFEQCAKISKKLYILRNINELPVGR